MHMKSKSRYLSEVFLETLDENFTKESVLRAVEACEREFNSRSEDLEQAASHKELLDFWDVYREFDELFQEQERASFQLLHVIRKVRDH